MIMGVAAVGHGGPTPKPRCVPAHSPFPQLFTATVAQIETNPSGKWRVSVKSLLTRCVAAARENPVGCWRGGGRVAAARWLGMAAGVARRAAGWGGLPVMPVHFGIGAR